MMQQHQQQQGMHGGYPGGYPGAYPGYEPQMTGYGMPPYGYQPQMTGYAPNPFMHDMNSMAIVPVGKRRHSYFYGLLNRANLGWGMKQCLWH